MSQRYYYNVLFCFKDSYYKEVSICTNTEIYILFEILNSTVWLNAGWVTCLKMDFV